MKTPSIIRVVVLASFAVLSASAALAGPRVSVSAFPMMITNEGEDATFTLTASPTPMRRAGVNFVMTGTATLGRDYSLTGNFNKDGQIVIEAGQTSTTVTLHSLSDDPRPPVETATMNIIGGKRYQIGSPSHATVRIENLP